VGALAAELGVNHLFAIGKHARVMGQSARRAGLVEVVEYEGVDGVAEALKRLVQKDDLVLIKASRAVRLERVGDVLKGATI
jgi:UDP-N-acetylmuramoyl-tripeptide--D-alanyl-D-alanine ligase